MKRRGKIQIPLGSVKGEGYLPYVHPQTVHDLLVERRELLGVIARLHWEDGRDCDCDACCAVGRDGLKTQPGESSA
jgi:hypothetical protein